MFQTISEVNWAGYKWGLLKYKWGHGGPGWDLDTVTSFDGRTQVGWGKANDDAPFLFWGGDVVGPSGEEHIAINLKLLRKYMRQQSGAEDTKDLSVSISLASFWWNSAEPYGDVIVEYEAYKGGDLVNRGDHYVIVGTKGEPKKVEKNQYITAQSKEEGFPGQGMGTLKIKYNGEGEF